MRLRWALVAATAQVALSFLCARPPPTTRRRLAATGDDFEELEVFSKRKKQSEERYPYEVIETSPPRQLLGVFSLSTSVGCGDVLRFDRERAYVVKRVASQYKYVGGRFLLRSKRAEATELERAKIESRLEKLVASTPGASSSSSSGGADSSSS